MAQRIIVLSDLHLAPRGPLSGAEASGPLAEFFCSYILELSSGEQTTLVLNGDTFDLLQVDPRPNALDLAHGDVLLETALTGIFAREGGQALKHALRDLLTAGHLLIVIPGNHDAELHQPRCRQTILRALGLPETHPGLELHLTPGPRHLQVGRWEVVIAHGHRADPYNDVDPEKARAAIRDGTPSLALPPGSRLVLETLHLYKHAVDPDSGRPRFPFIDFLHPDVAVFAAMVALNPWLAGRRLPGALPPIGRALLRKVNRKLMGGPVLGPTGAAQNVAPEDASLEDFMAASLVDVMSLEQQGVPDQVIGQLEQWLMGVAPARPGTLAAGGGWVKGWMRALLRSSVQNDRFFDLSFESELDNKVKAEGLPIHVGPSALIVGHTHAARFHSMMNERVYLNTGTWIPLLEPPPLENDEGADKWLEALAAGTAPSRLRQTFAEVTGAGPALLEWREGRARRLEAVPPSV